MYLSNKLSKRITETLINEIETIFYNKNSLNEMALNRDVFVVKCLSESNQVYIHFCKICLLGSTPKFAPYAKHWREEIATYIYNAVSFDIKRDTKDNRIKKKAYIEGFVESHFNEDLSKYKIKMMAFAKDAINSEGIDIKNFKKEDIENIIMQNQSRIIDYMKRVVSILSISDDEDRILLEKLKKHFSSF